MKKKTFFAFIAVLLLLAASCEKHQLLDEGTNTCQTYPRRPGTTIPADPPELNPNDSILPPHIEKWILFFTSDFPGCGGSMHLLWPMPDNWFGPDARAITLNWLDSTYTSQAYESYHYNVTTEGHFHLKDTIKRGTRGYQIVFDNGISMSPFPEIKSWGYFIGTFDDYAFREQCIQKYRYDYPEAPEKLISISASYWPTPTPSSQDFGFVFFRLNPHSLPFIYDNKSVQQITNNLKQNSHESYKYYPKIN
jgi:hypothetical protein